VRELRTLQLTESIPPLPIDERSTPSSASPQTSPRRVTPPLSPYQHYSTASTYKSSGFFIPARALQEAERMLREQQMLPIEVAAALRNKGYTAAVADAVAKVMRTLPS